MKKILLCTIFLTACIKLNAQRFRSFSPAKWRYFNNYHKDTVRIIFFVNGKPIYFTYYYCGGMHAGKLFTTRNIMERYSFRACILPLLQNPAEMSPEELWRAL